MSALEPVFGNAPGAPTPDAGRAAALAELRPRTFWYGVAAAVLVVGCGGAVVWFAVSIAALVPSPGTYPRVAVPGERAVTFDAPGTYRIYAETSGRAYSGMTFNEPNLTITDASGVEVPTRFRYGSDPYNDGMYHGVVMADVAIPRAGSYRVTAEVGRASSFATDVGSVAFRPPDPPPTGILGSVILGLTALVTGLVLFLVVGVRRSSARRRLLPVAPRPMAPYAPVYGHPYAPGPPGGSWGAPPAGWGPPAPPAPTGWSPPPPPPAGWAAPPASPASPPAGWAAPPAPPGPTTPTPPADAPDWAPPGSDPTTRGGPGS